MWLSILCLVPFNLNTIDPSSSSAHDTRDRKNLDRVKDCDCLQGLFEGSRRYPKLRQRAASFTEDNAVLGAGRCIAKLVQRLGLLYLRPKARSWRYRRGLRSLELNLRQSGSNTVIHSGALDSCLRYWGITGRLPYQFADDMVQSVLELFVVTEDSGAWHGACLALAELARRGDLLPHRLPDAVEYVANALKYEIRKGTYSIGANVSVNCVFNRALSCNRAASPPFKKMLAAKDTIFQTGLNY
ncbi:hypothetical protein PsorP6_009128 [Peronosclerospora sorghi]|uniref:Uncharacterized protein n=1 Tax=Peronosclerospora sorghi TaxID=230839 RepID=A0ACC0VXT1_9STRA|nr:hypothetical protein PsorP6_009128 [Peronosclerospora sorghi]